MWDRVDRGGLEALEQYPDHTLVPCSPSPGHQDHCWAAEALRRAPQRRLVYIGEEADGCTGSRAFHTLLATAFVTEDGVVSPRWSLTHGRVFVLQGRTLSARTLAFAQDILSKSASREVVVARRITCINKDDREGAYGGITHIGGEGWRLTRQEAIRRINTGSESFYVERPPGDHAVVVAGVNAHGNLYLTTTADGDLPHNLHSLPECR